MTTGSRKDPTVIALVDTSRSEYLLAEQTILPALRHWGMAHAVIDLATQEPSGLIDRAGVILVGQEYMGETLQPYLADLTNAVTEGAGLVNLDHTLFAYPSHYHNFLDITDPSSEIAVDTVITTEQGHPIGASHPPGSAFSFRQPLPATRARHHQGVVVALAEDETPLLVSGERGSGRIVQWYLSPKLWNIGFFGLAHGLDGLLWRAIVWAGPKPFPMNAMPPFVRFRFDDCHGYWRNPDDLAFVDELNRRGHTPSICCCIRALTAEGAEKAARLQRAGKIDLAPHTLAPGTSLFYGDESGEYTTNQLKDIFTELDEVRERWQVEWSKILSDHEHEWSYNAVPFLRERGIRYKMNITLPGERWTDPHIDWHPGPYGAMHYALDHLPGDLNDFFAVFNHHPSFDSARVYMDSDRFLYHRPGGFGRQKWDFLNGLVRGTDPEAKDLTTIVDRIEEHNRIALDALFFGGSISHSHFTRFLSIPEWQQILDKADSRMDGLELIPESYDNIATYAEARVGTELVLAQRQNGGLRCKLKGTSKTPLRLSLFVEEDGRLLREEYPIPPFTESYTAAISLT